MAFGALDLGFNFVVKLYYFLLLGCISGHHLFFLRLLSVTALADFFASPQPHLPFICIGSWNAFASWLAPHVTSTTVTSDWILPSPAWHGCPTNLTLSKTHLTCACRSTFQLYGCPGLLNTNHDTLSFNTHDHIFSYKQL